MPKNETELIALEKPEGEAATAPESASDPVTEFPATGARVTEEPQADTSAPSAKNTELEQVKGERDQFLDRLARLQAEFENARKRAERDRAADRDYATASVVEQFLPVLDNFELALKSTGSAEQLRSGVELIVKQMEEVLLKMQVTPIAAEGEPFDPRFHEALGSVERLDLPDQHVAEQIRRGFRLRDRLLRPALVRVVSNPKQTGE